MHYVSWDRTNRDEPKLLAEAGPDVLATFTHDSAQLEGDTWDLIPSPESGAVAKDSTGREIVRVDGSLKRDKHLTVHVDGAPYAIVGETSKNFIIDDADGQKVAQFTSDHNGVRKAILEFEGETTLPYTHIVALAWASRMVLEARKMVNSTALIGFLAFLSVFIILVWLIGP